MLWTLLLLIACSSPPPAAPPPSPTATPASTPTPTPAPASAPKAEASPYGLVGADYACAPCTSVAPHVLSVEASSTLDNKPAYAGIKAFDGDPKTAWCEGVEGTGAGQALRVSFKKELIIDGAFVLGGYFKSADTLKKNARLKAVAVRYASLDQTVVLSDPTRERPLPDGYEQGWFAAATSSPATTGSDWPDTPVIGVEFEVVEAWPGEAHEDLCISEIDLLVIDPEEL